MGNSSSDIEVLSSKYQQLILVKTIWESQSSSIINCGNDFKQIKKNINKILDKKFQKKN